MKHGLGTRRLDLSFLIAMVVASAAAAQTKGGQTPPHYNSLNDYLSAMRSYPPSLPALKKDSIAKTDPGNPLCTVVTQDNPTSELASFNANAGVLWPGALIQFQSLPSGT